MPLPLTLPNICLTDLVFRQLDNCTNEFRPCFDTSYHVPACRLCFYQPINSLQPTEIPNYVEQIYSWVGLVACSEIKEDSGSTGRLARGLRS